MKHGRALFPSQFQLFAAATSFLVLSCAETWTAPFGMSDTNFVSARFTARVHPGYVRADGRSGLIWMFINGFNLDGANGQRLGGMIRTTEAGILDPTFAVGPVLRSCYGTAIQSDGKILVGATQVGDTGSSGAPNWRVFRVLTNGILDTSYSSIVFDEPPRFMALQPDGKLVVGAAGVNPSGNGGVTRTTRLNTDGSVDSSFHPPDLAGGVWGVFAPPVFDTNGAIYLAGGFTSVNGASRQGVVRLLPNGDLDPSFQPNGHAFSLFVRGLLLVDGGKVVIGGRLLRNGDTTYYTLLRLNQDGSLDPSFNLVPVSQINFFRARLLRSSGDGKILAVSHSMARFNSDGTLDDSFSRPQFGTDPGEADLFVECFWFESLADGGIVVPNDLLTGASATMVGGHAVSGAFRLNADGTLDTRFTPPAFEEEIYPLDPAQQADGRLLVCGAFDRVSDLPIRSVARLNPNGTLDSNFNVTITNLRWGSKVAALPENRSYALLALGPSRLFVTSNILVRLQANGEVDPTFDARSSFSGSSGGFSDLILQGNQPIVSGSDAQSVIDGRAAAQRFLPDGTADPTFVAATNVLGKVYRDPFGSVSSIVVGDFQSLTVLSNGQVMAAITLGDYPESTTQFTYGLFRLNSDGSVDNTYTPPVLPPTPAFQSFPFIREVFGGAQQLAIYPLRFLSGAASTPEGGLLLCGAFGQIGGVNRPGLARLLANGTLDPSFPAGSGPSISGSFTRPARIDSIKVDGNGKIWVTGNFDRFHGVPANGLVRLNSDGSLDKSFVPQCSYFGINDYQNSRLSDVMLAMDGSAMLLGSFRQRADGWPSALNRLLAYPPLLLKSLGYVSGLGFSMFFELVNGQTYDLEVSSDLRDWSSLKVLTGGISPPMFTDADAAFLPRRFYRVAVR